MNWNQNPGTFTGNPNRGICAECGAIVQMIGYDTQTASHALLYPCNHEAPIKFVGV